MTVRQQSQEEHGHLVTPLPDGQPLATRTVARPGAGAGGLGCCPSWLDAASGLWGLPRRQRARAQPGAFQLRRAQAIPFDMPHAVIVPIGHSDVSGGDGVPNPPTVADPNRPGRRQIDVRAWADRLSGLSEDKRRTHIRLPLIEPVVRHVTSRADDVRVLLVATDQDDPRYRHTDTATLAVVLADQVRLLTDGRIAAEAIVLRGNPTDVPRMWLEAAAAIERAETVSGGGTTTVVLGAGTPALNTALALRAWLAHDLGRLEVETVRVVDGAVRPDASPSVLSLASTRRHIRQLAEAARFAEVVAVLDALPGGSLPSAYAAARREAAFGAALMSLDVDGAALALTAQDPRHHVLRRLAFPRSAGDPSRGALDDLRPLLGLVLEVFRVRWDANETVEALALAHLIGEYLPHLAWQSTLGHALDPVRLAPQVSVPHSLWPVPTRADNSACSQRPPAQATAAHAVGVANATPSGWEEFLRSRYSGLGECVATCATRRGTARLPGTTSRPDSCTAECGFWDSVPATERVGLHVRCLAAQLFQRSPVLRLRHHSPVGHYFGVPTRGRVGGALARTLVLMARRLRGVDENAAQRFLEVVPRPKDISQVPGSLTGLLSFVADRPVPASRLIALAQEDVLSSL